MHLIINSSKIFALVCSALIVVISGCSNGNGNAGAGGTLATPPVATSASYQLVWSDEFDGDSLDLTKWQVQLGDGSSEGNPGWGNAELQYYTAANITQTEGNLVITAREGDSPDANFDYTSGRIRTQGKLDFTYGRVEASIRVPQGVGLWAAFWMLGSDPSPYGVWAGKGEIDIMESFGQTTSFSQAALHYGMQFPLNQSVFKQPETAIDPTDGFHQYAVEWDIDQVRWYIDGEHFFTVRAETYWNYYYKNSSDGFVEGTAAAPFNSNQHILLNMAVGGNPSLPPTAATVFPAEMLVEYVNVYECPIDPENTGLGCAGSIDEVNPFLIAEVDAADAFMASYDLYVNGASTLFADTEAARTFDISVFDNSGALVLSEVATADGGSAIDVVSSGGGNFSMVAADGGTFNLLGMGSADDPGTYGGEIKFDIHIISGAETDLDGSLQVRVDSGFPDVGLINIPVNSLPVDQWTSVSVKISDMLLGGQGAFGGAPADVHALVSLVTLEPSSAIHMQVNNIRLACGHPSSCGIDSIATTPLTVFDDAVDSAWGRGIEAFDTVANTYSDGATANHISWQLVDTAEAGHDTVIETTFDNSGASGVTYIGGPANGSLSLASYADGELVFDVRVLSNPNNHPMIYKVDGTNGGGTGEQSLGVLPLNEWQTFNVPVENLQTAGLDLNEVTAFVLFPTFAGQDVVFQWDNIRFETTTSGAAPAVELPVDFETVGAFYNFINFEGGVSALFDNPDMTGNSSANVAQMRKLAATSGATFGGSVLTLDNPIDFSSSETITMKVWSTRAVRVNFKLEGLDNVEQEVTTSGSGWEVLSFDFTGQTTNAVSAVSFIFDNGVLGDWENNPADWTFYYDDIEVVGSGSAAPMTGTLVDAAVAGVTFSSTTQSGVTNAQGEFLYLPGEMVTFSIGGIVLGTVEGASVITPVELTGSVDPTSDAALNLLVFLQSLDSDQNHANGINISNATAVLAAAVELNFSAADFDSQIAAVVSQLTDGVNAVVSDNNALMNFYQAYVELGGTNSVGFLFPGFDPVPAPSTAPVLIDFEGPLESYVFREGGGFGGGAASVVSNPDTVGNSSANVGQMLKFAGEVYGGTTLELASSIDIPAGSAFTMKVWSTRAVPVLLKLEGGPVAEVSVTHSGSGWEELSFDFSAVSGNGTNALTLIFDLGVNGDAAGDPAGWTFYFDDIALTNAGGGNAGGGSCSPSCVIDFEANGFGNAGFSWDVFENDTDTTLTIGANPDSTANGGANINTSAMVASVTARATGGEFTGAQTAHGDIGPLTLDATNSVVKVMVYKSVISDVGLQLVNPTNGAQPPVRVSNTLVNQWEELTFDLTGLIGLEGNVNADRLVIFVDLTAGRTENIVYFDNITFGPAAGGGGGTAAAGEFTDFEGPLESYVFRDGGGFGGGAASVISNPDTVGNNSAQVGQMQKFAGEVYGGATLDLASSIDIPAGSAFTMKVWSTRVVDVLFKLEGGPVGEVTATHGGSGWEELSFDFTGVTGDGMNGVTLIFDLGINGDAEADPAGWTFYFDDITLGTADSSTGGGGGTAAGEFTDFEGPLESYVFREGGGFGGGAASVVSNPDTVGNSSANVGQMLKFAGEVYGGTTLELASSIDIPAGSAFTMKVWSTRAVPVLLKLEGGPVAEVSVTHGGSGWEELSFDFSAVSGNGTNALTLIFDLGVNGDAAGDPANWTFYFDDITLASAGGGTGGGTGGTTATLTDFEGPVESYVFREGGGFAGGAASVISNPETTGNSSANVGQMLKFSGEVYGGTTLELGTVIDVPANSVFTMQVWSMRSVPVLFKLEGGPVGEISATHGGSGWEELSFDFAGISGSGMDAVTLIFDLGVNGDAAGDPANWTFYFDDIVLTTASSGGGGGGTAPEGELASNGGFETGDFTGWAQYPSPGTTQSITTTNPAGGIYAANVNIPAGTGPTNNVLKLERLLDGTGQLSQGQVVSISFDYRGTAVDGGVVFVENFCETADPLCGNDLTQLNLTTGWANYSATFTLGAGVTGYTLQLAAVCGGATTCMVDLYLDNVSVTVANP